MKRVTDSINVKKIEKWTSDIPILISAGTGRGKTTWVLKVLLSYCYEHNLHILYLSNRKALKSQTEYQIDNINIVPENLRDNIKVMNYQELSTKILNKISIEYYDYIVQDEAHYYFSDSAFSNTTDVAFNYVMRSSSIKIFMTATPQILIFYLNAKKIKCTKYRIDIDYNNLIECMYMYFNNKCVKQYIMDNMSKAKILYFTSKQNAYRTSYLMEDSAYYYAKYKSEGKSKNDDNLKQYKNILENSKFNCKLFCCTSVLDNGVNFIDDDLKIIITDYFDLEEIIQQIGRKRIQHPNEKIVILIKNHTNKELQGRLNKINKRLEQVDYLKTYGTNAFTDKYKKINNDIMIDKINVKDDYSPRKMHVEFVVNDMAYVQVLYHKKILEHMINNYKKDGFRKYIKKQLSHHSSTPFLETIYDKNLIVPYLDSIIGKKLFKEDEDDEKDIDINSDEQERLKQFLAENDNIFNPIIKNHDSLGYGTKS